MSSFLLSSRSLPMPSSSSVDSLSSSALRASDVLVSLRRDANCAMITSNTSLLTT